jgi:type II secretory pathway pseudopilin PulG
MTLIEMLVGLLIVLIMMTFIGTIYVGAMRIRSRTQQVSEITLASRAALDLVRRDLAGAFPRAAETTPLDPAGYTSGAEFHWEAPADTSIPPDPNKGFRRLTFVSAMDGSRTHGDTLEHYEYSLVSWALRGTLFRKVAALQVSIGISTGTSWTSAPAVGAVVGGTVYSDGGATFTDVGVYRGAPYVMPDPAQDPSGNLQFFGGLLRGQFTFTSGDPAVTGVGTRFTVDLKPGDFIMGGNNGVWTQVAGVSSDTSLTLAGAYAGDTFTGIGVLKVPLPVTAILCYAQSTPPSWATDFAALGQTIETDVGDFWLFSKVFPDGRIDLGPNEGGGNPYFVLVEPAWWSLGEGVQSLVFYPPASYGLAADRDGDGTWEDGEAGGTADGIWTGPVPRYVDVHLTVFDPKHRTGKRMFGQRITIPAGEVP